MKEKHINFQVTKYGTFINKQYPWLHATPDFLCWCDCCGDGCGEVKCPYCLKDTDLEQYINKYNSCLKSENGDASLKREHAYYYQTQQQIFTAGKLYCDFVVCGFHEQIDLFCERILPDSSHWHSVVSKLHHFWRYCVLPEILGRWYTQSEVCLIYHLIPILLVFATGNWRACGNMHKPSMPHFYFSFILFENYKST